MGQPIAVAIMGCQGRMGRVLLEALHTQQQSHQQGNAPSGQMPLVLGAALVRKGSPLVGLDVGEVNGFGTWGVQISDDLAAVTKQFDLLIDFTCPETTLHNLGIVRTHGKAMVIGTTGFDAAGKTQILAASATTPIVSAANYSVGVNLMLSLLARATEIMGEECDVEIIESHHRMKVDAPSGTAIAMGEAVATARGRRLKDVAILDRCRKTGARREGSIGFASIRAADIVGEHTVMFADAGERLEFTHKATNRLTFAQGALRAARWLSVQSAGLYNMQHVLNDELAAPSSRRRCN
ncbi:MAG: 4-hydroxy-tetrahydrodipicolinate reductase [Aeromonas sp.]